LIVGGPELIPQVTNDAKPVEVLLPAFGLQTDCFSLAPPLLPSQQQILEGRLDFDRCIATPDMMSEVIKVARVLGPRGIMPTIKKGKMWSTFVVVAAHYEVDRLLTPLQVPLRRISVTQ
jgi:hypothetical protein